FFRGFRLFRIVHILILKSRFIRATNRGFGEMAFEHAVRKYRDVLVSVIGDTILVRSLDTIQPSLVRARISERIGAAMEANRDSICRLVRQQVEALPGTSVLLRVARLRDIVGNIEAAAVDVVITTLKSPDMNRVVQDATAKVLNEWREQVKAG